VRVRFSLMAFCTDSCQVLGALLQAHIIKATKRIEKRYVVFIGDFLVVIETIAS
jgi:hypothetical protein